MSKSILEKILIAIRMKNKLKDDIYFLKSIKYLYNGFETINIFFKVRKKP
jgi:hypothetical protein